MLPRHYVPRCSNHSNLVKCIKVRWRKKKAFLMMAAESKYSFLPPPYKAPFMDKIMTELHTPKRIIPQERVVVPNDGCVGPTWVRSEHWCPPWGSTTLLAWEEYTPSHSEASFKDKNETRLHVAPKRTIPQERDDFS